MILGNKTTCPQCGRTVSRRAKFCPDCGVRLGGGVRVCGACGTENRSDAQFCKQCGRELAESQAPDLHEHRWSRQEGDFAVRMEAKDVPGLLKSGLVIDLGVNALLLEKGAVVGEVPPGDYTLDTLGDRIKSWFSGRIPESLTALLVEITPTEFIFHMGGIFTSDPLRIGMTVRLQAEVKQPGKFLVNMLKGRERLSKEALRQHLYPEVAQVAERWVRGYTVEQLGEDPGLKEKFELALDEALRDTFAQNGLRFLNVRVMELNLEHLDRIKGIHSKYALDVSEAEAEAQGRKHYLDAKSELDLVELAEETQEVELEEQRVELHQRMREAMLSDRMNEVSSTAEFEEFLDDIDREKLLREKERQEMIQTWEEQAEDHQRARAHLLAKLEIEQNYELRAMELKQRADLDEQALDAELRLARMRATKEEEIAFAKWEFKIRRERAQAEFEREQAEADLQQEKLKRSTHLALEHDEFDEDMRQKVAKLEHELKKQRVDFEEKQAKWDLEEQKLEFELEKKQQQLEMDLQRERIQIEHELNRLDKLGELGAEALIAASPIEQGNILADLKKQEVLQGMSEEQILAAAAERSPHVAKALEEKFKAMAEGKASQREREMYEKLLAEREASERASIEAWDKASARAKETTERALDRMADTARAFADGQSPPQVIITGTGSTQYDPPPGQGPAQSEMKTCPNCGRSVEAEAKHCEHCGHKFEGV